jgi:Cu+-exporting ATPase
VWRTSISKRPSGELFVLAGRFLEAQALRGTGAALRSLAELAPTEAAVREGGVERLVPVDQLRAGQVFVVRPEERAATDGQGWRAVSAMDDQLWKLMYPLPSRSFVPLL